MVCRYCGNDSKEEICEYCRVHIDGDNMAATSTTSAVRVTLFDELKEIIIKMIKDRIKTGIQYCFNLSIKAMVAIGIMAAIISIIYYSLIPSIRHGLFAGLFNTIISLTMAFCILYVFTTIDKRKEIGALNLFKAVMIAYIPALCIFIIRALLINVSFELGTMLSALAKTLFAIVLYNILIDKRLVNKDRSIIATLTIALFI